LDSGKEAPVRWVELWLPNIEFRPLNGASPTGEFGKFISDPFDVKKGTWLHCPFPSETSTLICRERRVAFSNANCRAESRLRTVAMSSFPDKIL